jgi:hypothetical protein
MRAGVIETDLVRTRRRHRIRSIFLHRRESYGLGEVQRLTGLRPIALRRAIAEGEIEAAADLRITWQQLAAIAVDQWGIEIIEEELGEVAAQHLPPLVRTASITLRLPRYQVAMLEAMRTSGVDINAAVADLLLGVAEERAEEMEQSLAGFIEAMRFPEA